MPQQIGPAASNEFVSALYYAPPPQQPPNMFAAYWSGFLRERTPWAREVFSARLRALDPSAKLNALVELEKQVTARQKAREATIQAAMRSGGNLAAEILRQETNLAMQASRAQIANMQADVDILGQQTQISDAQRELLKEASPIIDDLRRYSSAESYDDAKIEEAVKSLKQLNKQAYVTTSKLHERQAWDRLMSTQLDAKLTSRDPKSRDFILDVKRDSGMSLQSEPLQKVSRAGVDRGAVTRGLDTALDYGVPLGGGGSVSVRRSVPDGEPPAEAAVGAAPGGVGRATGATLGMLQALSDAYAPAVPLGVTRADIEFAADPRNSALGGIGEGIWFREPKRARRKREALAGATPFAQTALATGAQQVAEEDPLAGLLTPGPAVREATEQAAGDMAARSGEKHSTRGKRTRPGDPIRPTEADEEFAAAISPDFEVERVEDDDIDDFLEEELVKAQRRTPEISDETLGVQVTLPRKKKKKDAER